VPTVEVVHLHNQSARQNRETTQQIGNESEVRYWQKHYSAWIGAGLAKPAIQWRMQEDDERHPSVCVDLGPCVAPPVFSVPGSLRGEHLWQLSPFPSCVPAIARFVSTMEDLTLPQDVWNQLGDGDFYARLFSLPDWQPVHYWRWRKASTPT
jgi:hypothetical protein